MITIALRLVGQCAFFSLRNYLITIENKTLQSIEYKYDFYKRKRGKMTKSSVDLPSLFMVLSFTINIFIGFLDPTEIQVSKEVGVVFLICGGLIFVYVLLYLRSGFFGETEPKLDFLVTKGPYRFCRHPQYLSFIIIILGLDLMFRSIMGIVFTFMISIPSVVYRAKIEDELLRNNFGEEWENYADKVGFLLPKLRKRRKNDQRKTF